MDLMNIIRNLNVTWHGKYGLGVTFTPIQHGVQLKIEYKNEPFVVRAYLNKDGVKLDYSQVKNEKVVHDLKGMLDGTFESDDEPIYESSKSTNTVFGLDESGKGDIFGGIAFGGVYVGLPYEEAEKLLSNMGVKDCKELSDDEVVKISQELRVHPDIATVVSYCSPEMLNDLMESGSTVNDILKRFHEDNIEGLFTSVEPLPDVTLIDMFANEDWLSEMTLCGQPLVKGDDMRYRFINTVIEQKPRGEGNLVVAAASIMARYRLLRGFDDLTLEYGMEFPKGANNNVKDFYKKNIEEHYPIEVQRYMRKLSYKV